MVGVTVRLKYLPRDVHTIAAFYPDFRQAAAGVLAVGRARVQPAIMELLDGGTLAAAGRNPRIGPERTRGRSLLLVQTDGFGAAAEADVVRAVLAASGATVTTEASAEAERLVELRRNSRGVEVDDEYRVGEDVAVPRSRLVDYVGALEAMAAGPRASSLKVVAHAGDGNLHPTFWVDRLDNAVDADAMQRLNARAGRINRRWPWRWAAPSPANTASGSTNCAGSAWSSRNRCGSCSAGSKSSFDPAGILNPGKAI